MSLNISRLLTLESMKKAVLSVTGEKSNDIIKGISLVDNFADIGDQKGKVALLIKEEIPYLDNCIKRLKEAGALGIIAKIQGHELADVCSALGLCLITLPCDANELKIVREVGQAIIDQFEKRENYIRKCYNSFYTDGYDGDVNDILKALSDMLDTTVIAYYVGGRIGSMGRYEADDNEVVAEGEENGRQYITIGKDRMYGVIVPFRVLNRVYGRLFIKTENEIAEHEWYLIKGAMTAVTMATTREFAETEIEQKMKNELLNDLIAGDIRSENSITARAEELGWDIKKPFIAVVCKLNMMSRKTRNDMLSVQCRVKTGLSHLMDERFGGHDNWIIGAAGDTVNVLWPFDIHKSYAANCEDIRGVLTRLFENEYDKFGLAGFTGGIGSEATDIFSIKKSFDDAASAIKYGNMTGGGNYIYDISGLGIYRFIGKIGSREELVSFIPHSLRRLMEYDSTSKNVLVDTLDVYLTCDCNINKASQQLDIHYKTLVYRIGRIKEIMELENIEGDVRLEIQLALKILRMLERTEK